MASKLTAEHTALTRALDSEVAVHNPDCGRLKTPYERLKQKTTPQA